MNIFLALTVSFKDIRLILIPIIWIKYCFAVLLLSNRTTIDSPSRPKETLEVQQKQDAQRRWPPDTHKCSVSFSHDLPPDLCSTVKPQPLYQLLVASVFFIFYTVLFWRSSTSKKVIFRLGEANQKHRDEWCGGLSGTVAGGDYYGNCWISLTVTATSCTPQESVQWILLHRWKTNRLLLWPTSHQTLHLT